VCNVSGKHGHTSHVLRRAWRVGLRCCQEGAAPPPASGSRTWRHAPRRRRRRGGPSPAASSVPPSWAVAMRVGHARGMPAAGMSGQ
jgi:hypothetical protein